MFVTEDFNVGVWISLTQRFERWQSKNEIANRAAADDQNTVHASTVTALYERRNRRAPPLFGDPTAAAALNIA
jgi:hypothetical protein